MRELEPYEKVLIQQIKTTPFFTKMPALSELIKRLENTESVHEFAAIVYIMKDALDTLIKPNEIH